MTPILLSAKPAALKITESILSQVQSLKTGRRPPGLAVVQVGSFAASNTYIKHKVKAAAECGFEFFHIKLDSSISLEDLKAEIVRTSEREEIDGLIVQLPLDAAHLQDHKIVRKLLETIPPEKDADGLNTINQGKLFTGESKPHRWSAPLPATPLGVYRLIEHYKIPVVGKNVVVIGKSRLVGFPTAGLLSQVGATVTLCHRRTDDITPYTKHADIIVVAAGVKHLLKPDHIKKGVTLVDVGIHVQDNGKLTGDVDPACYELASAYSPVPGGVGPMTVASLMENTFCLYKQNLKL